MTTTHSKWCEVDTEVCAVKTLSVWFGSTSKQVHLTFKLNYNKSKPLCGILIFPINVVNTHFWAVEELYNFNKEKCVACDNLYKATNGLKDLTPELQLLLLESTEL